MARRSLPRGLRPASRLVSIFADRGLRDPWERPLQSGADPRFLPRRRRAQNVQIARQRHRAAGDYAAERRRYIAPVGGRLRLYRGCPHRSRDPQAPQRRLPSPAQYAALPAGRARWLLGSRGGWRRGDAGTRSLGASPPNGTRPASAGRGRGVRFPRHVTALYNFCAVDLSAFYFDIRKDRLYCDAPDDISRRAARTVLDRCLDCLVRWLAPITCFTAEEAWLIRHSDAPGRSIHLELILDVRAGWRDEALGERWVTLRDLRRVATGALELERGAKRLGSSLQAAVELFVPERLLDLLRNVDIAELCITSAGTVRAGPGPDDAFTLPDVSEVAASISAAPGDRCERCWRVLPEVGH